MHTHEMSYLPARFFVIVSFFLVTNIYVYDSHPFAGKFSDYDLYLDTTDMKSCIGTKEILSQCWS